MRRTTSNIINAVSSIATFYRECERNTNLQQFTKNALTRATRLILNISNDMMNGSLLTTAGVNKTKEALSVKMIKQAFQG
jgi:hypothetical protein